MQNTNPKKILIFTTSKEKNGTAKLRDTVEAEIPEHFKAVRSYYSFLMTLLLKRKTIKAIFALSNMHFIISVYLVKRFKLNVPVVIGMYHPNQWKIIFTDKISKTRFKVIKKLSAVLTHNNIIHSSKEGVNATNFYCNITQGTPTILQGPAEILPFTKKYKNADSTEAIKIVTIGRLVDFKVCTIIAMINTIEKLVPNKNLNITYDIYGNGPSREKLAEIIEKSSVQSRITLHNFVPKEEYLETVINYDLFFGMAGALILAASSGVVSLIAIQEEKREVSYGFISDYNQEINPIFGDQSKYAVEKSLEDSIVSYNHLSTAERLALSEKCFYATKSYSTASTREGLLAKFEKAEIIKNINISTMDIAKMFFEIKKAKHKGYTDAHT